jgi:hypothetical protein
MPTAIVTTPATPIIMVAGERLMAPTSSQDGHCCHHDN